MNKVFKLKSNDKEFYLYIFSDNDAFSYLIEFDDGGFIRGSAKSEKNALDRAKKDLREDVLGKHSKIFASVEA